MCALVIFGPAFGLAVAAAEPCLELLSQARFAERAGDAKRAAVLAETALGMAAGGNRPGERLAVHREAQDILLAAGRGEGLVRYYDDLLRGHATDPVRRYLRARVEPDVARRRQDLEAVLLMDPGLFWAAYDLAELHARAGRWERALTCAGRAVELSPGEAAAWNVLGHLRLESSRFLADAGARRALALEAHEALERAIEIDPGLAEAHYNLGLVRHVLGEKEPARRSWLKAVEIDEGFAEALNALGHASAREGELDEAIAFYQKALRAARAVGRELGSAHNNVAVAYYRQGRHAHAFKHMAKAEAAGYEVVPSFRRAVVREIERRDFMSFQREVAGARERPVRVFLAGADGKPDRGRPAGLSGLQDREIVLAVLKAGFRDSGGGVSLGERRVHGKVVARYREAARLEIDLVPGGRRELVLVAREGAARPAGRGSGRLETWVADAGLRFSAEAPELVRLLSDVVGLEVREVGGAP